MKVKLPSPFLWLLVLAILFACTDAKNRVTTSDNNGVLPSVADFYDVQASDSTFSNYYSFADSVSTYADNTVAECGYCQGMEARMLLQFASLPDSSNLNNIVLKLYISDRSNDLNGLQLRLGKCTRGWVENQTTWWKSGEDSTWTNPGGDFTLLDGAGYTATVTNADSVVFTLNQNDIASWLDDGDYNYGFMVVPVSGSGYVQLYTGESSNDPKLVFTYIKDDGDVTTHTKYATVDTFIYDGQPAVGQVRSSLVVGNSYPESSVIKFALPPAGFTDLDPNGTFTADQLLTEYQRMTINKAELWVKVKADGSYGTNEKVYVTPYLIIKDQPNLPLRPKNSTYPDGDYISISGTNSTSEEPSESGWVSVDITSVLQAITDGSYENYGIFLTSTYHNHDFTRWEFYSPSDPITANRPFMRVYYTPPYLEDR